jgi:hypothetical protein
MLSGIAEGLTLTETMTFLDWNDACDWASKCTLSNNVNFVIRELRGPNGEKDSF